MTEIGVTLTIVDAADNSRIDDFRVLAGTPSGISEEFEKTHKVEVINWQSHTIRAGQGGTLFWSLKRAWPRMALRIEAAGYVPHVCYGIEKQNGSIELICRMQKDPGISGSVMMPGGDRVAADATIALAMIRKHVTLKGAVSPELLRHKPEGSASLRDQWDQPLVIRANKDGNFTLPTELDPTAAVVIVHSTGVLQMRYAEWRKSPHVTLKPWGLIHGRVQWGDQVGAGESVTLSADHGDEFGYYGIVAQYDQTVTDDKGRFVFPAVLPGRTQLSCPINVMGEGNSEMSVNMRGRSCHVDVKASHTSAVIGGKGVTVNGRLTGADSFDDVTFHVHPTALHFGRQGDGASWAAWMKWKQGETGHLFFRDGLKLAPDGTFQITQMLPGYYQVFFHKPGDKQYLSNGKFHLEREDQRSGSTVFDIGDFPVRHP